MIGAHPIPGGFDVRRDEKPIRRVNPSGQEAWIARLTGPDGNRRSAGTFKRRGPCKRPQDDGACCAQHRIWWAYEQDAPGGQPKALTVSGYYCGSEGEDDGWLDRYPRPARTATNYRGRVEAILEIRMPDKRPFGDLPLGEVKRSHLMRLVDVMLREHGRAASGTRAVISVLSSMFENANDDGLMDGNPAKGVRVRSSDPRVQKPRRSVRVASWEEMHAFARAAGEREAMIRVLADCGLRLGEMLALECRHVRGDVLVVEQNAWDGEVSKGTKQGDRREVPVPPALAVMLAEAKRDRIGLLFPGSNGGAWDQRLFYRPVWYPTQRASGLMLRPHDFRHSYVSHLRAAGIDPAYLAAITGHTVMTATTHYTHSVGGFEETVRRAVG